MKKLLTAVFTFWCGVLTAQDSVPQNSLAIVAGPNWLQHLGSLDGSPSYDTRVGYSVGLDYTLHLSPHWQMKAGFRYAEFNSSATIGPLTWPSEYSTGQYVYDPTLPRYITVNTSDHAMQYFVGMRLLSKPGIWRVYADADMGLTDLLEPEGKPNGNVRLTLGAGLGVAWQSAKGKFSIFVQPELRYVFQNFGNDISAAPGDNFLIQALEAGTRYHF